MKNSKEIGETNTNVNNNGKKLTVLESNQGNVSELMSEMTVYFRRNHPELPANIWISNRIGNMSPRMWIQRNKDEEVQKEDTFTMAIDDAQTVAGDSGSGFSIKDFEYFQRFILINKSLLLAYWNEELDTEDLVKRLVLDMNAFDWEIARLGFLETEPLLNNPDVELPLDMPMPDYSQLEFWFIYEMESKYQEETLLPMNIWIDDSKSYVRHRHSKRIRFQLDKEENLNAERCGSMDLDGNIIPSDLKIEPLTASDLAALRNFIRNNRYALEHLADEDFHLFQIFPNMIKGGELASETEIKALNELVDDLVYLEILCGMANKRKAITHLPMNIWIDEALTYKRWGLPKMVRFQTDTLTKFDNFKLGIMDLSGNVQCPDSVRMDLGDDEINLLRNFVLNNKYALDKVADNDIWLDEIWDALIKGGEPASEEAIAALKKKVDKLAEEEGTS